MKKKRVLHRILVVAGISLMSWLLYYLVWFLFDPDLRMEFYKGWPFHPLETIRLQIPQKLPKKFN